MTVGKFFGRPICNDLMRMVKEKLRKIWQFWDWSHWAVFLELLGIWKNTKALECSMVEVEISNSTTQPNSGTISKHYFSKFQTSNRV